jgi:hypothetical protein
MFESHATTIAISYLIRVTVMKVAIGGVHGARRNNPVTKE